MLSRFNIEQFEVKAINVNVFKIHLNKNLIFYKGKKKKA